MKLLFIILLILLSVAEVNAHSLLNRYSGFESGFGHPILGIDHFIAMIGVGLWGAQIGSKSIWVLPISFPLIMTLGSLIAISSIYSFLYVEIVIILSVIILGLVIAFSWSPHSLIVLSFIFIFALYHGFAHGNELPNSSEPLNFITGFVISTGLIHLFGVGIGYYSNKFYEGKFSRVIGGVIFFMGLYLLIMEIM